MKYLILTLITFSLFSCGRSYSYLADPIFAAYGKEMKKSRGYLVEGTGGSMPKNNVKTLFMSFLGEYEVDIAGARRLYIEVVEGLIQKVNSDKTIRAHLQDYPVTAKNMDIFLSFNDRNRKPVAKKHIAFVYFLNNKICYSIFNYDNRQYDKVYEELYEEALQIIQNEPIKPRSGEST